MPRPRFWHFAAFHAIIPFKPSRAFSRYNHRQIKTLKVRTTTGGIMIRNLTCQWIRRPFACSALLSFFAIVAGSAQTPPIPKSLVTEPINDSSLVTLTGNTLRSAQLGDDRGPAPGSLPAQRLMLILKRSPQQEIELRSFLQSVQDPKSSDFRRFLSPDEFGQRYGLSDADLAKVQGWLRSHGLSISKVNRGRTAIEFSGTVSQVEQTFHTPIHRFVISGAEHLANISDPQVPAALGQVVAGVSSLNDLKPRPHTVMGPSGKWNPELHRYVPELTVAINGSQYLFVGPGDAATIYDSPNSFNNRFASGQTVYDGTGVTIGIAGTTFLNDPGPSFYRTLFGIGMANSLLTIYDGNQTNLDSSADETEAILDTEVSGGLAPGATVAYYAAGDTEFQSGLFLAIYRAIDDNIVDILSVSYGNCEEALGAAGNAQILNAWEQAAAQGITVTVSSGDSGSAGCDNPNTETVATHGLAINGLASTPYNIAVGGTDFDILSNNFSTYVYAIDGSHYTSAISYIPENPWNDSTTSNGLLAANTPYKDASEATNIFAAGGGASSFGQGGQTGYSKPLWQQGFAPSNTDTVRDVPDVSLLSGNGLYGALWAICIGEDGDCSEGSNSTIHGVGGTSAAAPAFAGILAMVEQKEGASTRLGQANAVLYRLAQSNPSAFHQIITGNNSVYCSSGSLNCAANEFLSGYNAGSSYNMATGLGSVDVSNLVNDWAGDALTPTSTTLSLDKTSFPHGTNVSFGSGVNPAAATGNVAITTNYASQPQATGGVPPFLLTLSGGSASGSFSELPGGTYNVYANYGGDATYAGSTSQPVQVQVSPENSVLQFSVATVNSNETITSVAGQTIPLGSFVTLNAQPIGASQAGNPSPITNATGTILFNDSYAGGGLATGFNSFPLDSTGNAEANTAGFNAGAHSLTASYSGDLSYNASNAGPINFTVAMAPTIVTIKSSASSTIGASFQLTPMIANGLPSGAPNPTGLFTLTDTTNNTVLGSVGAYLGAVLEVYAPQLTAGNNNLVATYGGDPNYLSSSPSAPVVVNCIAGCGNGTGQTIGLSFGQVSSFTIVPGQSLTSVVSVLPGGGFTGAVNLTCSIAGQNSNDQKIPTCSFSPAQINVTSNQSVSSTLTIGSTAATTSALRFPPGGKSRPGQLYAAGGTVLATILLLGITPRRLRRRYLIALIAIFLSISWVTACGGGGSGATTGGGGGKGGGGGGGGGGTTIPGTSADSYTVTFHAADAATGTVTAQDYFNFTVN
jgi:hypothetical protein